MSPILFILYIGSLYEKLKKVHGIMLVGFSDDTNIISIGRDPESTAKQLEAAWKEDKTKWYALSPRKERTYTLFKGEDGTSSR